jgi:hypothetical protein
MTFQKKNTAGTEVRTVDVREGGKVKFTTKSPGIVWILIVMLDNKLIVFIKTHQTMYLK